MQNVQKVQNVPNFRSVPKQAVFTISSLFTALPVPGGGLCGCFGLILPGGLGGVEAIAGSLRAQALIQRCSDRGCWLAAICAAPTILANLGFLDRRRAVCYPGMEGDLVKAGVEPCMTEPFVVEGHLITGRAAGSSFDFGLALLTALSGADVARQVQNAIHYMA